MSVDIESRVKRANLITRDEHLEQLFGDETSNRLLLDILAKKEGRMTDNRPDQQPTPEKVQTQRTAPTQPQKRFRLGVALAAVLIVVAVGVAFATVSNRGSTVAEVEPGPVTSFDDIAGTIYWDPGTGLVQYLYFLEDGTINVSTNPDLVVDRPSDVYTTRFDGTQALITYTGSRCPQPDQGGTYEIHLLENGSVQFLAIDEDPCALRSGFFQLLDRDGVSAGGFVPVP